MPHDPHATPATSAPAALAEPPQPPADTPASAPPDDPNYPRPPLARIGRFLLRRSFLALLAYPVVGLINLAQTVANQGFGALGNGSNWLQAFFLNQLGPYVAHHLIVLAPAALILNILAAAGYLAHQDYEREQTELERRKHHEHIQTIVPPMITPIVQAEVARVVARDFPTKDPEILSTASAAPSRPRDFALLPIPEKDFVGREEELAWLEDRLRQGGATGITAVSGLGGIGKTALAGVAVRHLFEREERFPDGVAVVDCRDKTDALAVLREALAEFAPPGSALLPEPATAQQLATAAYDLLRGKDALLVFDNVEPELNAALLLEPLRAADTAVLLTARELLPLPPDARRELKLLPEDAALIVFAQAYGRPSPDDLDPAEHAAARRIVHALDSHTLAVRLAGAEAADRALDEYVREVEAQPLRVQGANGQRALEETLMRSIKRLPDDARRLFAALPVFATGEFGRFAASAVAEEGLDLADPEATVDLLVRRALLEQTLDARLPEGSDRERLRLHPLLRTLADELADDADHAAASHALAAFYADYANTTPDAALAPDLDNIAGAIEWAHESAPAEKRDTLLTALCVGMQGVWRGRSRTTDSLRYLPWGIAALRNLGQSSSNLGYMLREYGSALQTVGDISGAEQAFSDALDIFRSAHDDAGVARLLEMLGRIDMLRGQLGDAEAKYREAEAIFREKGETQALGILLSSLGDILKRRGDLAGAQANYERYLTIMQEVGDTREAGVALGNLGDILVQRGDLAGAQANYEQSLAIRLEVQDRRGEGVVLSKLGDILVQRGDLAGAQANYERLLAIMQEVGDTRGAGVALSKLGDILVQRGDLAGAQANYERYLTIMQEVLDRKNVGIALYKLAQLAEANDDLARAETLHRESLAIAIEIEDVRDIADSYAYLGAFLIEHQGKRDEGCGMLQQAIALYHQMGVPDEAEARATAQRLGCDV